MFVLSGWDLWIWMREKPVSMALKRSLLRQSMANRLFCFLRDIICEVCIMMFYYLTFRRQLKEHVKWQHE